jgi:lipoprotein NlpD
MINLRLLLILIIFLSGCAEQPAFDTDQPVVPAYKQTPIARPQTTPKRRSVFQVKKGDTLYSIGFGSGFGYELLAKWNNIPKPYKLRVGQKIKLYNPADDYAEASGPINVNNNAPAINTLPEKKALNTRSSPAFTQAPDRSTPADSAHTAVNVPAKPPKKTTNLLEETSVVSKDKQKMLKLYWKWPIQGKLLKNFAQTGSKGINIAGKTGEPVHAAANGEVVYSGNGLIGYGNLLIIKHDDLHLSAYANNASLQVHEGQKVTQGQIVAHCGKSASGIPSLHFEIRKNGKSVNPLLYLPTQ